MLVIRKRLFLIRLMIQFLAIVLQRRKKFFNDENLRSYSILKISDKNDNNNNNNDDDNNNNNNNNSNNNNNNIHFSDFVT